LSEPLVLALVAYRALEDDLAAGFEEEGVPLTVEPARGDAVALARTAAKRALLGLGIGASADELVLVLAPAPRRAYLVAPAREAAVFARNAARVAARRPLRQL
jgi:hypothetical protein